MDGVMTRKKTTEKLGGKDLISRCATCVLRLEKGHVAEFNRGGENYGEEEKCYNTAV